MIELPEPDSGDLAFLTKQQMKMIMDAGIAHGREQMREECVKLIDTIDDMEQSAYRHCQEAIRGLK